MLLQTKRKVSDENKRRACALKDELEIKTKVSEEIIGIVNQGNKTIHVNSDGDYSEFIEKFSHFESTPGAIDDAVLEKVKVNIITRFSAERGDVGGLYQNATEIADAYIRRLKSLREGKDAGARLNVMGDLCQFSELDIQVSGRFLVKCCKFASPENIFPLIPLNHKNVFYIDELLKMLTPEDFINHTEVLLSLVKNLASSPDEGRPYPDAAYILSILQQLEFVEPTELSKRRVSYLGQLSSLYSGNLAPIDYLLSKLAKNHQLTLERFETLLKWADFSMEIVVKQIANGCEVHDEINAIDNGESSFVKGGAPDDQRMVASAWVVKQHFFHNKTNWPAFFETLSEKNKIEAKAISPKSQPELISNILSYR